MWKILKKCILKKYLDSGIKKINMFCKYYISQHQVFKYSNTQTDVYEKYSTNTFKYLFVYESYSRPILFM